METHATAGRGRYLAGWTREPLWPRAWIAPLMAAGTLAWVFRRQHDIPITAWWPARHALVEWPVAVYAYVLDPRRMTTNELARLARHICLRYRVSESEAERIVADGLPVVADWLRVTVPAWRLC